MMDDEDSSIEDPLQHLDALLSLEAAHLTDDELSLVADMVQQLVGAAPLSTAGGGHQLQERQEQLTATPAGLNLAAQIEQLLPGAMQAGIQEDQQLQLQQQQRLSTSALAAHSLGSGAPAFAAAGSPTAAAAGAAGAGASGFGSNAGRAQYAAYPSAAAVTGLASPSSSIVSDSEHSRPASPVAPFPPQHTSPPQAAAVVAAAAGGGSAAAAVVASAPAPTAQSAADAATRAAAEVLSAALADPNASIEDIVGIFDKVLAASGVNSSSSNNSPAGAGQQPQQQPEQQPASLHSKAALQEEPAGQQRLAHKPFLLQPDLQPETPKLGASRQLSAQQQQQQQAPVWQPDACGSSLAQQGHPSSRLSTLSAQQQPEQWWQRQAGVSRPSTSPPSAGNSSKFPGALSGSPSAQQVQHAARASSVAVQQQQQQQQQQRAGGGGLMTAAPAKQSRSCSPDVFKRLSAVSTVSYSVRTSGNVMPLQPPRHSTSPTEVERNWLGSLRGSPSPVRDRSNSRSRSPSCSPGRQQGAQEPVPWLTAASVQSARQSCPPSPGPLEWDADTRSVKAGSGWVSSTNRNSPNRRAAGAAVEQEQQEQQEEAWAAKKAPIKLPAHVLEERMRRFYERNLDWKRRCAQVYEQQRAVLKQGETEGCTFAPAINRNSEKMAQELRASYPMRSVRPLTPLADASTDLEQQRLRKQQQQRRPASTGRIRPQHNNKAGQHPSSGSQAWMMHASIGGSSYRSACSTAGGSSDQSAPPGVRRLFEDAAVRLQRAEQYRVLTKEAERKARSWSAPRCAAAEGVPSRVYDHFDPERNGSSSSRARGTRTAERDECLFQPWTNPRPRPRSPRRAASEPPAASEPADEHSEVVEQFVALLDSPEGSPGQHLQHLQQQLVRPGTAPAGSTRSSQQPQQQQQQSQQQQSPRSPSARRIGSACRNADLDWDEFIDRQSRFVSRREAKVAAVAASESRKATAGPEVSPGSKRILANKQALSAGCSSPRQQQQDFLARLQQQSQARSAGKTTAGGCSSSSDSPDARHGGRSTGGGSGTSGASSSGWMSEECTFKPVITPKAAAKKARSAEDMSEGDRLRKEVRLEQLRTVREAQALSGATFKPDLSPSRQRAGEEFLSVPPKLSLSNEGLSAYMASLQEKRRLLDERRKTAERRKQEEELRQCTFKPETTPVPAYLSEMSDVGYTARYIDRVMQSTAGRVTWPGQPNAAPATPPAAKRSRGGGGGDGGRPSAAATAAAAVARALEATAGGGGAGAGAGAGGKGARSAGGSADKPQAGVISTRY